MKWETTQTPRILVVDDNRRIHEDFDLVFATRQRNLELEADHAEFYGESASPVVANPTYEVDHAFSGLEGIAKTQSSLAAGAPYQVAFVDIRMPGMDGVETIGRLWAIDPRIQVVICTAFADYRWEDLAGRLGQSDKLLVLKKPFDHIEAFQLACTLSEKWFLTRHAALKFEQMELLVAQRTQRLLDLQRREARQPDELDQIKLRLLTRLTESLRPPLTHIHDWLEHSRGRKPEAPGGMEVRQSAAQLLHLVEEGLNLGLLAKEDVQLQAAAADMVPFLQGIVDRLQPEANRRQVRLEFQSNQTHWPATFDARLLEKVLVNLGSGALALTPENGRVSVQAEFNPDGLQLVIQDTGAGVSPEGQPRGAAVSGQPPYFPGLSLAFIQELLRLQGGTLAWQSPGSDSATATQSPGTRFILQLPLPERDASGGESPAPVEAPTAPIGATPAPPLDEESGLKEQPLILLVMDRADAAAQIQQGFGADYRTLLVKDGTQGLIQAREMLPDVIIAEVALSVLDGIELCRKLKNDELTGHIPVILIADHGRETGQLQALEAGADDYLLQPLNFSLLRARVDNLHESRQKLAGRLRQVQQLYPRDLATNQSDAKFIRRVIDLVEENLADCDFDLEIMARKLAVSRRQLFRKLGAAAGCSPNTFIRTLRLRRAAQLLTESQMTVTEITYAVGFSDLKYFRTIFRDYYGVSPGEYLKRSKTP